MDKKTFAIGILSVTALILFVANLIAPRGNTAFAAEVVKDRDYQAVIGRMARGGEALYLTDNRTGMMAVMTFNPQKRQVQVFDVKAVASAFAEDGNDAGGRGRD